MENDATEPGKPVAPSDKQKIEERLRKLEEEAALLRAQVQGTETPAEPANEPGVEQAGEAEEPVEEELIPPTGTQILEADKLIARARLEKTRGNNSISTKLLEEAQKVAPTAPAVLELIGDDFAERGAYKKALDVYAKAKKIDPKNITLDRKHAEMVYRTSAAGVALTTSQFEAQASARSAVIFSVIIPGLGQLLKGETGKGIAFVVVWISSLVAMMVIPNGLKNLVSTISGRGHDFNVLVVVALLVAIITWISAVFDANIGAGAGTKRKKGSGPVKPTPPVDLPY